MKKSFAHTDGMFVRRRNTASQRPMQGAGKIPPQYLVDGTLPRPHTPGPERKAGDAPTLQRVAQPGVTPRNARRTLDFDLSLDDEKDKKQRKKKGLLGWRPTKKFFKRLAIAVGILLLLGIGYFAYKIFVATGNVFRGGGHSNLLQGNGIDLSKLQKEGDGRVNVLLAATSEDDPAHVNAGADLTDSIMIVSIDPVNKGASLISIPRDLWVKMPGCNMYSQEKINAAYQCGKRMNFKESGYPDGGMGYLQKIVEGITDVNINYYAKINYTAFRQAVDAVGGIDITIESSDPRGILDRNFDWICNYKCFKVKWPNGPAHLNGEHALYLARSRNDPGAYLGYGLPRGDFDRTNNQRKMLIALRQKATSISTLSNPIKLSNLIDSIGNNLVTNFSRDDILKLSNIAKDMPEKNIKSIGLADGDTAVLTTGASPSGASIVRPKAGLFDYTAMQLFVRQQTIDPYIIKEAPTIALYNGSGVDGLAATQKELLVSYGYNVVIVESAPTQDYTSTVFYDSTKGKKQVTKQYLQNRYKTKAKTEALPTGIEPILNKGEVNKDGQPAKPKYADYVIILGQNSGN